MHVVLKMIQYIEQCTIMATHKAGWKILDFILKHFILQGIYLMGEASCTCKNESVNHSHTKPTIFVQ